MGKRMTAAALILLLCLAVLTGCGQGNGKAGPGEQQGQGGFDPSLREEGIADATLMVYMVGSDLESKSGAATSDIVEMVNSDFDFEHKNLIVMTGGAKTWRGGTGISAEEIGIYQLNKRGINKLTASPKASMGLSSTLADFLHYSCEHFPAQSYGLILWNHGGGPMNGYGEDELFSDWLSLTELREGLEQSPFGAENRLAFLGFDACLMASAEVSWTVREFADYMIASEEVIPGGGWDYQFLSRLSEGPFNGAEVGYAAVDSYSAYYSQRLAGQAMLGRLTLSCLDLRGADAVEQAVDQMFSAMVPGLASGDYPRIAKLRQETLPFAKYTTNSDYDLIDLGDLAEMLLEEYPDEAEALLQALDNMVVYAWSPLTRAHGLSLYYPLENTRYYRSRWGELYPSFGFAPGYSRFMAAFGQELLGGTSQAWGSAGMPSLSQDEESEEYYVQLSDALASDYMDGSYVLLRRLEEGHYTICGERRDLVLDSQNRLCTLFGGYSVYVMNSVGDVFPALYYDFSETGSHDYHVAATLHTDPLGDGEFRIRNVWFLASLPGPGDSEALNLGIERKGNVEDVAYGKEEVSIHDYPMVYFPLFETWEARDEEGRILPFSQWRTEVSDMFAGYDSSKGWRAELRALGDDGYEYFIQIIARDIYGREYGSELIPVRLTQRGEERKGEMFQDRFYPLPARSDPVPRLPALGELRYLSDSRWYSPISMDEQLVMDDASGMRMTLLTGAYRLDNEGEKKDLILIFRLDNNSRYFDLLDLVTDANFRVRIGEQMTRVYFLPETVGVWIRQGGSYYYTMSIPLGELPEGAEGFDCVFRMSQKEWTGQLTLSYETEPVHIPLPREQ